MLAKLYFVLVMSFAISNSNPSQGIKKGTFASTNTQAHSECASMSNQEESPSLTHQANAHQQISTANKAVRI